MSTTLLNALSALQTQQKAMQVTSHNIANATTPGYTRQRALLTTNVPQDIKPGQLGRGVRVAEIQRINDDFIVERLRSLESEGGRLDELNKLLADLELTFNEPSDTAFSNSINRFFAAFEDLSNNAESNAARSGTIEQLRTFTSTFNQIAADLARQRETVGFALEENVREINQITEQLGKLNQDIRRATAGDRNPNDLLDTRDNLLRELSNRVDVTVRYQPDDSVLVELDGRLLVSSAGFSEVGTEYTAGGTQQMIYTRDRRAINASGGSIAALQEMNNQTLPSMQQAMDDLAVTMLRQFNTIHATGANHTARPNAILGNRIISADMLDADLDDIEQLFGDNTRAGIPQGLLPSFIDDDGNPTATNLTINVLDTATGIAEKYVVRYEPGTAATPASRSLKDLVDAINTGVGGGFSVHPPTSGGIPGLTAQYLAVDGGYRFSLDAADGLAIDFSRSLDLQPATRAWTGADITGLDTNLPGADVALAGQRLTFRVADTTNDGTADTLEAFTIDPITRNEVPYGSVAIAAGAATVGNIDLNFAGGAASYVPGQTFSVDLDATTGDVVGGPLDRLSNWTAGSATVGIYGQYTGAETFDPAKPWSMEVVQGGVVGAPAGTPPPNGPPMVKFSFEIGDGTGNTTTETVILTLDENYPPGSQVPIAEGVYAVFGEGTLSANTASEPNRLAFIVDGQPDQARLLAALGMQSLFEGTGAADIRVASALTTSPTNLLVGHTRAAGDNANTLAILDARREDLLAGGTLTFEEFYQGRVSEVAVRINQVAQLQENQADLKASLENRRDEISGVSIDEEVGLLILQQQAYQAAARIISIERENIQTLVGLLG